MFKNYCKRNGDYVMASLRNDLEYMEHKGYKIRKMHNRTKNHPCYIIWNKVKKYLGIDFEIYMSSSMWNFTIIDGCFVSLYWD